MIASAQKAPVTSAALSALNLAVVRHVVFERAAEQIFEKSKRSTEAVVRTAEESRQRSEAVTVVIEQNEHRNEKSAEIADAPKVATAPAVSAPAPGKTLDIKV